MKMHRFYSVIRSKTALAVGAGLTSLIAFETVRRKPVYCDASDYQFDPNVPVNLPSGNPKWDYDWDKRQPYSLVAKPPGTSEKDSETKYHEELEKHKATTSRIIYLVRVGHYDEDKPEHEQCLTEVGREQMKLTAQRLEDLAKGKNFKFSSIISSSSPVASQSAKILAENLGKSMKVDKCDPMLTEGCPALPDPQSPSVFPEPKVLYEDGSRIEAAFRKYFHRAEPSQKESSHEIIVCDSNVIRYFVCRALQLPPQGWLRFMLTHGSINILCITPKGGVSLRALGESGFLPPTKLTA